MTCLKRSSLTTPLSSQPGSPFRIKWTSFYLSYGMPREREKVTFVSDQDQFFEAMGSLLAERVSKYGITLIRDSDHPKDSADFRSSLLKLRKGGIDVFVLNLGGEQNLLSFLSQHCQLALSTPLFGTKYLNSYAEKEEFRQLLGSLIYFVPPSKQPIQYSLKRTRPGLTRSHLLVHQTPRMQERCFLRP